MQGVHRLALPAAVQQLRSDGPQGILARAQGYQLVQGARHQFADPGAEAVGHDQGLGGEHGWCGLAGAHGVVLDTFFGG
jgi:hypothetical protein